MPIAFLTLWLPQVTYLDFNPLVYLAEFLDLQYHGQYISEYGICIIDVDITCLALAFDCAPKDRMAPLSCRMLCKVAWATMVFFWRTAKVLIVVRTSASSLHVKVPPATRMRSLLRSSSQHYNSCVTTYVPDNLVPALYSFQRVTKYSHSSLVPASDKDGRFTLSAFVFVAGRLKWLCAG